MLRSSLCLLFTALFVSAVSAQGYTDVQSLQYEFGSNVSTSVPLRPVVYAPAAHLYCFAPAYACPPYYASYCYPAVHRRAVVRPVYYCPGGRILTLNKKSPYR